MKLNIDGAFRNNPSYVGVGVVLRDNKYFLLNRFTIKLKFCNSIKLKFCNSLQFAYSLDA